MIAISRSLAHDLYHTFRTLGSHRTRSQLPITLSAGPDGLRVRACTSEVALEYHQPGAQRPDQLSLPLEALHDVAGADDSTVRIYLLNERIEAYWLADRVTDYESYPVLTSTTHFPTPATTSQDVAYDLVATLAEANAIAPRYGGCYAVDRILLRGEAGEVIATNGSQSLSVAGFRLPWTEDLLLPRTGLYATLANQPPTRLLIGRTSTHLTLTMGNWSLTLTLDVKGLFPPLETVFRLPVPTASLTLVS